MRHYTLSRRALEWNVVESRFTMSRVYKERILFKDCVSYTHSLHLPVKHHCSHNGPLHVVNNPRDTVSTSAVSTEVDGVHDGRQHRGTRFHHGRRLRSRSLSCKCGYPRNTRKGSVSGKRKTSHEYVCSEHRKWPVPTRSGWVFTCCIMHCEGNHPRHHRVAWGCYAPRTLTHT